MVNDKSDEPVAQQPPPVQWFKDGDHEVVNGPHFGCESPHVHSKYGAMRVLPGDWIVAAIAGEYYPLRRDVFNDPEAAQQPEAPPADARIRALEADLRDSLLLAWGGVCPPGWVVLGTPQEMAEQIRRAGDALQAELAASRERERANERDAMRYREFRRVVYIDKDESFDAYDADQMDAELDRRIAERKAFFATPDSAASPTGGTK